MFDTLTGLLDRVGLKTNIWKTMGMVCCPCRAAGVRTDEAYIRQITGAGRVYKERQQEQVICPEWGGYSARGSLAVHRQTHHDMAKGGPGQEGNIEGGGDDTRMYRMEFPEKAGPRPCPVEGCSVQASTWTEIQMHFWHRHIRDTAVIL